MFNIITNIIIMNMINYYYGQNAGAQGGAQPYPNPYKSY